MAKSYRELYFNQIKNNNNIKHFVTKSHQEYNMTFTYNYMYLTYEN